MGSRRAVALLALLAAGCRPGPHELAVDLRFDPPELAARVESVQIEVRRDGCDGEPFHATRLDRDEPSVRLPRLGRGVVCIEVTALDASCRAVGAGRDERELPLAGTPSIMLLVGELSPAECRLPFCRDDSCSALPAEDAGVPRTDGCVRLPEVADCVDNDCDGAIDERLVDTTSDPDNCGEPCRRCEAGTRLNVELFCESSRCGARCAAGFIDCNGDLADDGGDGCEVAAAACDGCCAPEAPRCELLGGGGFRCRTCEEVGLGTTCDGGCVDTETDPDHCGGCGRTCDRASQRCAGGDCLCQSMRLDCDSDPGDCEATRWTLTTCELCGDNCLDRTPPPNTRWVRCDMGACVPACRPAEPLAGRYYLDCDGDIWTNGCETVHPCFECCDATEECPPTGGSCVTSML